MRKPSSILVGGKRFDILPPRSKSPKKKRAAMRRDHGATVHLGPTALRQLEAMARLDGSTLNAAAAHCILVAYEGTLRHARDAMQSPYAADRVVAAENIAVLKGAKRNTARNLRDR